jgi:Asp/Glu/hydantoin racemase
MTSQESTEQGRIGLIHTVPTLLPVIDDLMKSALPDWARFHMTDESLLKNTIRDGVLAKSTMRRLLNQIWSAVDAGADAIVVTCSSLGGAVDAARPFCPVPLFRIDQGMAEEAVRRGGRIGVLATLPTTLAPTSALIKSVSEANDRSGLRIVSQVCEGAFARLSEGDTTGHDQAVADALTEMASEVDVIVLAQASMARALDSLTAPLAVPVLTSPELGVAHIRDALVCAGAS